ncbi:MAG TPA: hypothetical protein ENI15_18645 [Spirochaetes bacterium]|nr:hypothetical protein [Spirochaetota bacterium]
MRTDLDYLVDSVRLDRYSHFLNITNNGDFHVLDETTCQCHRLRR